MQSAHKAGLSVDQARGLMTDYFVALNGHIADPVDDQATMQTAIKELGSEGPVIAEQVNNALNSMHATQPFTEDQAELLRDIVRAPGGLGLMFRAFRNGASTPPASLPGGNDRMTRDEVRTAMTTRRYIVDDAYRQRIQEAHAAMTGETPPAGPTRRTLSLG